MAAISSDLLFGLRRLDNGLLIFPGRPGWLLWLLVEPGGDKPVDDGAATRNLDLLVLEEDLANHLYLMAILIFRPIKTSTSKFMTSLALLARHSH